jgi:hypothetical protein
MKRAKEAWAGFVRCKSSGGMGRRSAVGDRDEGAFEGGRMRAKAGRENPGARSQKSAPKSA